MAPDPGRSLTGRIGAYVSWARTADRSARTQPGREASDRRFERLVDPDGAMAPDARRKAAGSARTAHYLKMARASADARARKAAGRELRQLAADVEAGGDVA